MLLLFVRTRKKADTPGRNRGNSRGGAESRNMHAGRMTASRRAMVFVRLE